MTAFATTSKTRTITARGRTIKANMVGKGRWMAHDVGGAEGNGYLISKTSYGWKVHGIGDIASVGNTLQQAMEMVAGHYNHVERLAQEQLDKDAAEARALAVEVEEKFSNLTIKDVMQLHRIVVAAQQLQQVAFVNEDNQIAYGTARSIGDEHGNFLKDADIRNGYLRVTMQAGGVERFARVGELVSRLDETFAILV